MIKAREYLNELDKKYPNRRKEIHKQCCKKCPTENIYKNGGQDCEIEDLRGLSKEVLAKEIVFVCAWRNSKLCKGICYQYGITQNYLNALYK